MMPRDVTPGNCYQDCYHMLLDAGGHDVLQHAENLRLVHGYPALTEPDQDHPAGTRYGHAWLEFTMTGFVVGDEFLVDPQGDCGMQFVYDVYGGGVPAFKFMYYSVGKVEQDWTSYYTLRQASEHVLKHESYGPWAPVRPGAQFAN